MVRVLLSALACEPGRGTELEVGYRTLLAAASAHEVWLLTDIDSIPKLEAALVEHPHRDRIHLRGLKMWRDGMLLDRISIPTFHRYYDWWQRQAARLALELDSVVDFDVVHHVTLASYWTRAGVAVLGKPFVWGPVGGGVQAPWQLLPSLGWRGAAEHLARRVVRAMLGRTGPSRHAMRTADVAIAQNEETLRRLRVRGSRRVLTNALVVDLSDVPNVFPGGTRLREIHVVGRLLAWKAPTLALAAVRAMRADDVVLRFFGTGPEQPRIERLAQRWGMEDRVRFEGWVPREAMLSQLASAAALLHPSLHEEAGLCIAEALSLGTPVVALDHGGPQQVASHWPAEQSALIPPARPERLVAELAARLDRIVAAPPPVQTEAIPPDVAFEEQILDAYAMATGQAERSVPMRGFPRGKVQFYASNSRGLAVAAAMYPFGRRIPRVMQASASLLVTTPLGRRQLTEKIDFEPICGWRTWARITAHAVPDHKRITWLHLRSQWGKQRFSAIALAPAGRPRCYLVGELEERRTFYPSGGATTFAVPEQLGTLAEDGWHIRYLRPIPMFHQRPRWDLPRIRAVAEEVAEYLDGQLHRPDDIPADWGPIHGDFVPWNLREDAHGRLWLLDWENAGWGPPLTDLLRYVVAQQTVASPDVRRIAARCATLVPGAEKLATAADFWLKRPGWGPLPVDEAEVRKAKDVERSRVETAVFEALRDRRAR